MATRNFHKNRTKERKARQHRERLKRAAKRPYGFRERAKYVPDFGSEAALSVAAASLLLTRRR